MKNGYDQFFKKAQQQSAPQRNFSRVEEEPSPRRQRADGARRTQAAARLARRKKSVFPAKIILFSGFGFSLCLGGFLYSDQLEKTLKHVRIGFIASALADEAKDTKPAGDKKDEKSADGKVADKDAKKDQQNDQTAKTSENAESQNPDNLDHLQKLVDRQKELEAKEEELKKVEEELAVQKQELEKKLKDLEEVRSQISSVLNDRVQADSQKVDGLVQLYTNMRPQQAAKVFETLDEDLTVEVLGRMKKKSAAEIMNLMKADKAKVISEKLAGFKRTPAVASNESAVTEPKKDLPPTPSVPAADDSNDDEKGVSPKAPEVKKTKP